MADGFSRKAEKASGVAAEVLAASAGLARDKGLRSAVRKHLVGGEDLLTAVNAGVEQFVTVFTGMGGLMASGSRPARHRAPDRRPPGRRARAGRGGAGHAACLVAEDLAPSDTAGLDPRWSSVWSPSAVARPATPRSSPASSGSPALVGVADAMTIPAARRCLVDGITGVIELHPTGGREEKVAADAAQRASLASWTGPGATAERRARQDPRQRRRRRVGPVASTAPVQGVGLFRTSLLPQPPGRAVGRRAGVSIYGEVLGAFDQDRYVVVRTLDAGSDKPVAFATHVGEEEPRPRRPWACGCPSTTRACSTGSSRRSPRPRPRRAPESWVMAPMVATVAEAADFSAKVRALGLKSGVMIEVPSAALLAHRILEVVDFLSSAPNDLTQYTMAADGWPPTLPTSPTRGSRPCCS